jgi:hypothetical protein
MDVQATGSCQGIQVQQLVGAALFAYPRLLDTQWRCHQAQFDPLLVARPKPRSFESRDFPTLGQNQRIALTELDLEPRFT